MKTKRIIAAAENALKSVDGKFDVKDCFAALKAASQTICPTIVSMVFDATENVVYWCEDRKWDKVLEKRLKGE